MGVRGLRTFITENGLLKGYRLHDCTLVIDGLNLLMELVAKFQQSRGDRTHFGGDYCSFALYIEAFLDALEECRVTPVVVMDGTFEDIKRPTLLRRFDESLKRAKEISEGKMAEDNNNRSKAGYSLLNSYMFVQILRKRNIAVHMSILEADDILPTIANDLKAPLLSADSDFLLENIPTGVITPDSLLKDDFSVQAEDQEQPYLLCTIYRLSHLLAKYTGLSALLTPLAGALLGNDYVDHGDAMKVVARLPDLCGHHDRPGTTYAFCTVFSWLATQTSPASVKRHLKRHCCCPGHPLLDYIEERHISGRRQRVARRTRPGPGIQSVEEYFADNYHRLFGFHAETGVPRWVHEAAGLRSLTLALYRNQVDFLWPLVEDYGGLRLSAYEAAAGLAEYVYGLLRRHLPGRPGGREEDRLPALAAVTRYVRVGEQRAEQTVVPRTMINDRRLPTLADISTMARPDRLALFFDILGFKLPLSSELKALIAGKGGEDTGRTTLSLSRQYLMQLQTLLLATVYLLRHYPAPLWIEFLLSLLVNILFMGYCSAEDDICTPKVLEVAVGVPEDWEQEEEDPDELIGELVAFDVIPLVSTTAYKARIVHQYNAWQACLQNLTHLASVLNLADGK